MLLGKWKIVLLAVLAAHANAQVPRSWAKKLGDWEMQAENLGWSVFNRNGQPFDPQVNLDICKRHTITIELESGKKDYSKQIMEAGETLRARSPPGGTIRLSAGVYALNDQVNIPSYVCLIGAGMSKTTLRVNDRSPRFKKSGVIRSFQTKRVTLADLTIDGNKDGQSSRDLKKAGYGRYGLFTELTNWLYMRNVAVINNLGYGFDPHGSKKEWAYFLLLEGCEARNNGLDGFTLDQTYYVALHDSLAENNARHGTNVVTGTRNCLIANNVMRNNGFRSEVGCNMMAQNNQNYGTNHIRFVRNRLFDARKSAFCFNDVPKIGVERNSMKNEYRRAWCYHIVKTTSLFVRTTKCTPSGPTREMRRIEDARIKFSSSDIGATRISTRPRSFSV